MNTTKIILTACLAGGLLLGSAGCAHSQSGAVQPAGDSEAAAKSQTAADGTAAESADEAKSIGHSCLEGVPRKGRKMARFRRFYVRQWGMPH